MYKLYKAKDKFTGNTSGFYVTPRGVAVLDWISGTPDREMISLVKLSEQEYTYGDITTFYSRAENPKLIAEWE